MSGNSNNGKSREKNKNWGTTNELEIVALIVEQNQGLRARVESLAQQAVERLELSRRERSKNLKGLDDS